MAIKTLIIIPCYNEEKRLPVEDFCAYIKNNQEITFLFVNDGSKDNTIAVLQTMANQNNVYILDNKQNGGKAYAIQSAIKYAIEKIAFDYVGFFDADLATPLYEIGNLKAIALEKKSFMVSCSRIRRLGSNIDRKTSRYLLGRFFATITSRILILPVYDTQCGAKIIRKDIAKIIFEDPFNSRWFFDIELYARIVLNLGYSHAIHNIYEYPMLEWIEKGNSKIKIKDFLKTPIELMKLNRIYHKKIKQIKKEEKVVLQ